MAEHEENTHEQSGPHASSIRLPYLSDLNNSCVGKTVTMAGAGLLTGTMWGATVIAWQDISLKEVPARQAIKFAFRQSGRHGVLFASVCAVFFSADCIAGSMTGGTGLASSVAGGIASGLFLLARTGNHRFALQCGAGLATASALTWLADEYSESRLSDRTIKSVNTVLARYDTLPVERASTPLFNNDQLPPPSFLRVDEAE